LNGSRPKEVERIARALDMFDFRGATKALTALAEAEAYGKQTQTGAGERRAGVLLGISGQNLGRSNKRSRRVVRRLSVNARLGAGDYRRKDVAVRSSGHLCNLPVVVAQDAPKTLVALDVTGAATDFRARFDQPIAQTLMIPLAMKMEHELRDRLA